MSFNLTPEERATGQANFERAAAGLAKADERGPDGLTRRGFMKSLALTGGVVIPVSAAVYFNYKSGGLDEKPVKTALIGCGDEGGVLMGEHNPKYIDVIAVCDFRPSNMKRIFEGDRDPQNKPKPPRLGLRTKYPETWQRIKKYDDIKKMLDDCKDIEAVIIALPLHLHAPIAIQCMKAKKHVLCEKLMAWNITQCKEMIAEAEKNDVLLSIGHQRHYSMLYAHAQELMRSEALGDVNHIRAQWHRNNSLPDKDKDGKEIPGKIKDSWKKEIPKEDREALEKSIRSKGYKSMEELCHWRLFRRTGGGLMAELGSHQLDACSIFLGKVKPLAVTAVGGTYFYKDNREVEDHVFCTFEFPGRKYWKDGVEFGTVNDPKDRVVVTYSSINTNNFEPYGECVMGNRGTMLVEEEQGISLFGVGARSTAVSISTGGGAPALVSSGSDPGAARAAAAGVSGNPTPTSGWGSVSRGYREEMEHFAYCVRMWKEGASKKDRPMVRCDGKTAMADAIIALTANLSMKHMKRIEFKKEWFEPFPEKEVPDAENTVEEVTG